MLIALALQLIGERGGALLAVREINFGNHRFDQIARNTGAPRDVLTPGSPWCAREGGSDLPAPVPGAPTTL